MKSAIYIGIDPAFRANGFTVCIIQSNELKFKKFKSFIDFIEFAICLESCIACVENSNLQNTSFDLTGSKAVIARKARNVGANQAISQMTVDVLRRWGHEVIERSPKEKGVKWLQDGVIHGLMREFKLTCSKTRFNQDERDAFKLVLHVFTKKSN